MKIEQAQSLIRDKRITLSGKTFHFEKNGRLLVASENEPLNGYYNFIIKNERCYLKTNPPLIGDSGEITFDIILGEKIILLDG